MSALVLTAWCWMMLGDVAVETDARVGAGGREVRVEGATSRKTAEMELVPRLALMREGPKLVSSLTYRPLLRLPVDLSAGAPELTSAREFRDSGEVLHRVDLSADAAATPNLALRLRASGAYGRIDLLRTEVYAREVLPSAGRLAWRSARATLEATVTPTQRTTLAGGLAAFENGGADHEARLVVPLQRVARVDATVRHAVTRRDDASLSADAAYHRSILVSETRDAVLGRLGGGWARQLVPTLRVRAASGVAWSQAEAPSASPDRRIAPWVEAALSHALTEPRITTELAASASPYVNPLNGEVRRRLEASAATTWRLARDWDVAARVAAAQERVGTSGGAFWSGDRETDLAVLDVRGTWRIARRLSLSLAQMARRQKSHYATVPTFLEWGAALELTVGARWPD